MSGKYTRARDRRALIELTRTEKEKVAAGFTSQFKKILAFLLAAKRPHEHSILTNKLCQLLREIKNSKLDIEVWPYEELLFTDDTAYKFTSEEISEFRAIFAQVVNSKLAAMTSGSVFRRHQKI